MLVALVRNALRWAALSGAAFVVLSILSVMLMRHIPIHGFTVMLERKVESLLSGERLPIQQQWRAWDELSVQAKMAVIAAEDQGCPHPRGLDLNVMRAPWAASRSA